MGRPAKAYSWPIDDTWKRNVDAKREARGMTKAELAALLGCAPANVVRMLQPISEGGYRSSSLAPKVAEIFGEPLPRSVESPDEHRALADELLLLSPASYHAVHADLVRRVKEARRLVRRKKVTPG